jgi:hypothetical protein
MLMIVIMLMTMVISMMTIISIKKSGAVSKDNLTQSTQSFFAKHVKR